MPAGKVTLVRERGEKDLVHVRVLRDAHSYSAQDAACFEDPEEWAQSRQRKKQENMILAETRGKAAEEQIARQKWVEGKIAKAEREMRESVALVEKLRSVRVVKEQENNVKIIDVGPPKQKAIPGLRKSVKSILKDSGNVGPNYLCPDLVQPKKEPMSRRIDFSKQNLKPSNKIKLNISRPDGRVPGEVEGGGQPEVGERAKVVLKSRKNMQSQQKLDHGSKLSTILEDTENKENSPTATSLVDEVDFIPVRGPSREDDISNNRNTEIRSEGSKPSSRAARLVSASSAESGSPTSLTDRRTSSRTSGIEETSGGTGSRETSGDSFSELLSSSLDLASIALFMDRIKDYRRTLENSDSTLKESSNIEPETVFKTVHGTGQGEKLQKQKFKIDNNFIQKVLEFETCSPLFSSRSDRTKSSTSPSSDIYIAKDRKKTKRKFKPSSRLLQHESGSSLSTDLEYSAALEELKQNFNPRHNPADTVEQPSSVAGISGSWPPLRADNISRIQSPPEESHKDSKLRFYIEKLLAMKHEDVENLSVSSVSVDTTYRSTNQNTAEPQQSNGKRTQITTKEKSQTTQQRARIIFSTDNSDSSLSCLVASPLLNSQGPLHSSLKSPTSLSSSSDSGKRVRFDLEGLRTPEPNLNLLESSLDQTMYRSIQMITRQEVNGGRTTHDQLIEKAPIGGITNYHQQIKAHSSHQARETVIGRDVSDMGGPGTTRPSQEDLSFQQIQAIFKEKRQELEKQLKRLETLGLMDQEFIKELEISGGSLSSSTDSNPRVATSDLTEASSAAQQRNTNNVVSSAAPNMSTPLVSAAFSSENSYPPVTSIEAPVLPNQPTPSLPPSDKSLPPFTYTSSSAAFNHTSSSSFKTFTSSSGTSAAATAKYKMNSVPNIRQDYNDREASSSESSDIFKHPNHKVQAHSTPRQIVSTTVNVYKQKTSFTRQDYSDPSQSDNLEQMRELSSFFSDPGTDSESGSKLSRIDLSSDLSNLP